MDITGKPASRRRYPGVADTVGRTPLVQLARVVPPALAEHGIVVLGKLEGNNPAGSVKDRPALSMIERAEKRGEIRPGDALIEATSGNTGIALAMAAAIKGYRMVLVMPENQSLERRATMKAYGAELVLVSKELGMEGARDLADRGVEGGQDVGQRERHDGRVGEHEGHGHQEQGAGRTTHAVRSSRARGP